MSLFGLLLWFLESGILKWRFTNFLYILSCYFTSLKCSCYIMHVGFKVHVVRSIFKWKCSPCSSFLLFFLPPPHFPFCTPFLLMISLISCFTRFYSKLYVAILMTHKTDVPALWLTQLLCSVLWYVLNIMSDAFHVLCLSVYYYFCICTISVFITWLKYFNSTIPSL